VRDIDANIRKDSRDEPLLELEARGAWHAECGLVAVGQPLGDGRQSPGKWDNGCEAALVKGSSAHLVRL
jgi:hypothetical protein